MTMKLFDASEFHLMWCLWNKKLIMFGLKSEFCLSSLNPKTLQFSHSFHFLFLSVGASGCNEWTHNTKLFSHEPPALRQQHCESGRQPRTRGVRQHHEDEGGTNGRRVCGLQQRRGRESGITHLSSFWRGMNYLYSYEEKHLGQRVRVRVTILLGFFFFYIK